MAKDPYNIEFLGLSGEVAERALGNALTSRITETLRELGPGFSLVGRQVTFDVEGDEFYVDLHVFISSSSATSSSNRRPASSNPSTHEEVRSGARLCRSASRDTVP